MFEIPLKEKWPEVYFIKCFHNNKTFRSMENRFYFVSLLWYKFKINFIHIQCNFTQQFRKQNHCLKYKLRNYLRLEWHIHTNVVLKGVWRKWWKTISHSLWYLPHKIAYRQEQKKNRERKKNETQCEIDGIECSSTTTIVHWISNEEQTSFWFNFILDFCFKRTQNQKR